MIQKWDAQDTDASFSIRKRAENFYEVAMFAEILDGAGDFFVLGMAVAIDEEEIFPGFAFAGAGFDFGQIDFGAAEGRERFVKRADFVRDADHEAGPVLAGGRAALAAEHEKSGGVGGVVLDVLLEDLKAVFFGGQKSGHGGGFAVFGSQFGGTGVRRGFQDFRAGQILLHPAAALAERLRMDVKALDLLNPAANAGQTILDGQNDLRDDF